MPVYIYIHSVFIDISIYISIKTECLNVLKLCYRIIYKHTGAEKKQTGLMKAII